MFLGGETGRTGHEHTAETPTKPLISEQRGTESGTVGADSSPQPPPDLAAVMAVWATLPEANKAGIVAMVKAAAGVEGK